MLYTPLSMEEIGAFDNKEQPESMEIPLKHGWMIASKQGTDWTVERVVSTNPADYLDESLTPGSSIPLAMLQNHRETKENMIQ
ncbi:YlzJ-like family protein [Salsuginibacillus kocurii]|uniref:YlzJ-like family protein n=1 Tax=Salsuginibacillus kocurii TaxID=427078 RepID=UPI00036B0181|nr:YlzJ-like family protein [Salsuginibacillus kocurii]